MASNSSKQAGGKQVSNDLFFTPNQVMKATSNV
jgi:hypothetical protein